MISIIDQIENMIVCSMNHGIDVKIFCIHVPLVELFEMRLLFLQDFFLEIDVINMGK